VHEADRVRDSRVQCVTVTATSPRRARFNVNE